MPVYQLLLDALNLMLIGMLCVGVFLGILVILIPLLKRVVPEDKLVSSATHADKSTQPNQSMSNQQLTAVISAAVQQYRNHHKNSV